MKTIGMALLASLTLTVLATAQVQACTLNLKDGFTTIMLQDPAVAKLVEELGGNPKVVESDYNGGVGLDVNKCFVPLTPVLYFVGGDGAKCPQVIYEGVQIGQVICQ